MQLSANSSSCPIIHFYTACILRLKNSSNAMFGFQLAKRMDYLMVKTEVSAIVFCKDTAVSCNLYMIIDGLRYCKIDL